jgi:Fuc2NAc and GlcNAc transferase
MAPIIPFLLLTILSYISVSYIRRLALRYEILDKPNERSSHSIPMPREGGLAIVFLFLALSLWAANQVDIYRSMIYIVLSAILALVGWRDDLFSSRYIFLTFLSGLLVYESSHGDQVAPFLIFLGLPLVWILLSIHAAWLPRAQ